MTSHPAISHINYWDQVDSWKFWNGPLCRNKSVTSLLTQCCSVLEEQQHRNLCQEPVSDTCKTLIIGEGGLVSELMWGIVVKKQLKYTSCLISHEVKSTGQLNW